MTAILRTGLLLALAAGLSACASPSRLAGGGFSAPSASSAPAQRGPAIYNEPESAPPVSSGTLTAEPLPPLAGGSPPPPSGPLDTGPIVAGGVSSSTPEPRASGPAQVAIATPGRSAVLGGWTAREATGSSCRVTLSSSPALDLYKASASQCQNRDLSRVTAWDFRDGEVYLYQPGGTVAARLRQGGGGLEGALAKSGAPLSLSR